MVAATVLGDERRADRDAAAERLADRDQVRRQAERREVNSWPVRPRPHWISSAMSSVPVRWHAVVDGLRELRRERPHAAFALDRLGDDRGGLRRSPLLRAPTIVGRATKVTPAISGWNGVAVVRRPRSPRARPSCGRRTRDRGRRTRLAARPACTSSGARTSGTPRPPRVPLLQKNARRRPDSAGQRDRRAGPAAGGSTGSTCEAASTPASAIAAASAGSARGRATATPMPERRSRYARPSTSNRRTPSPRTNATGLPLVGLQHVLRFERLDVVEP